MGLLSTNKILSYANKFQKKAEIASSAQPADIQKALDNAGLWGGSPFDLQGGVANKIFGILDKINYEGKFSASLMVSPSGDVEIKLTAGDNPMLKKDLQFTFGPKMTSVLRNKKILPAEVMEVKWLEGVGY
jgi:hypothetical protein